MVVPEGLAFALLISYIICLAALSLYAMNGFYLFLLSRRKEKNQTARHPFHISDNLPLVTVQLPVYNEKYVIQRLIEAVCKFEYPKHRLEIQILDDSTDSTTEIIRELVSKFRSIGFTIEHCHRTNRKGFKSGALRDGLETAKGEFVAVFDSDFLPPSDFLLRTLPYFTSPDIGLIQTRWDHLNERFSALTKVQAIILNGHFLIEQTVRNRNGYFINFNGTAGIWRKKCIIDAGNWQDDTLTEDLDLSYRAQLKGWKFVFRPDIVCPAELPPDISAWKSQQYRWAKGAIETCKKLLPAVFSSRLPLKLKIQSFFHLTGNFVYPLVLISGLLNIPMILIKNNYPAFSAVFLYMSLFVIATVSTFIAYWIIQNRHETSKWNRFKQFPLYLAYGIGISINNTKAVFSGIFNRRSEFVRTPKFHIFSYNQSVQHNSYKIKEKSIQGLFEVMLGFYCFSGAVISIFLLEFAALPFILIYGTGFFVIGMNSLPALPRIFLRN